MRYSPAFVLRRLGMLVLIVWTAVTINFVIPKLTPRNPLREKLLEEASRGGVIIDEGFDAMVKSYEAKFGLDQPLIIQYLTTLAIYFVRLGILNCQLSDHIDRACW